MKMLFPKATEAEFVTAQMMAPAEGMKYLSEAQKARNKPPAANTKLAKAKLDLQNGLISQSQYDALVKTENGGGFEGTGMDPQTYNAVVKYTLKKQNGQPTTQQEDLEYNLAHQRLSRTRTVTTPEGTYQIPGMDMSQFYNPGQQQGQPQAGQQPSSTPPAFTPKATKSVGQEATDREFAKTYAEYRAQGGRADLDKSIAQLEEVADALEGGSDTLTGPIMGNIPEGIKTAVFPESINMQNKVEEIVQRNLKIVLGSQFTEKEGEKLIARAYNPSLSEKENAKRVRSLLKTIQERRDSTEKAAKYFEENGGTLRGFNDSSSSEPKVIEYDSNGNPK
jgi:hypothetical protein